MRSSIWQRTEASLSGEAGESAVGVGEIEAHGERDKEAKLGGRYKRIPAELGRGRRHVVGDDAEHCSENYAGDGCPLIEPETCEDTSLRLAAPCLSAKRPMPARI